MHFTDQCVLSQMTTMLRYQQALNDVFDPAWRENRHQYLRAVVVEGAEAIDHHGYKWWKKQEKDMAQMQLELVDILHFYLSEVARLNLEDPEKALIIAWSEDYSEVVFDGQPYVLKDLHVLDKFELIIGLAAARRMNWSLFRSLMDDCEMDFSELHHQYAAKNVLNLFRQRHGDKQGTYVKVWSAKEDNQYLSDLMTTWKSTETMDDLYGRLEALYGQYAV